MKMNDIEFVSTLTDVIVPNPTSDFYDQNGSRYFSVGFTRCNNVQKSNSCCMNSYPDPTQINFSKARYLLESSKLECGQIFDVESLIGKGKYGKVYRVRSLNGEFYAIKELTHSICFKLEVDAYKQMIKAANHLSDKKNSDESSKKSSEDSVFKRLLNFDRFLVKNRDASVNGTLKVIHPFVMKIYAYMQESYEMASWKFPLDYKEDNTIMFSLLTEIGLGGDLSELAFNNCKSPMTPEQAVFYLCEVTEALIWLHDIGIIHQDIKSDNIFIKGNGHIILGDFGLATIAHHGPGTTFRSNIDSESHHMPPEIRTCKSGSVRVWHAVDWYSVGVLFHRLLFHRYPPTPPSINEEAEFDDMKQGLSYETWDLIKKMLACNPERRLGGGLSGGRVILGHPGLLSLLVPMNFTHKHKYSTPGIGLPNHVIKTIKNSLTYPTNQLTTRSQSKMLEDFKRRSYATAVIRNREPYLPTWIEELRFFIRNERLIPPFIPMSNDALRYRKNSTSTSASTSSSWISGYTMRSSM